MSDAHRNDSAEIAGPASGAPAVRRRRRVPAVCYLLLALVTTAVGWAFLAPAGSASRTGDDAAVANGKALFAAGCASCHGLSGQGVTGRAPSLIGVGSAAVDFQVSTGRMPLANIGVQSARRKAIYTQAEIDDLGAYIDSLGGGPKAPSITPDDVAKANLQTGGELFRANCAGCHNFAGAGNSLDDGRYAPPLGKATPKQIYEAMLSGPESMPVFGDRQLTPEEKLDIAKYVLAIRHGKDPGGVNLGHLGPIPEGLVIFIVGIGGLVMVTMWIGTRA